jgi:hypothetical protein
MAPKIGLKKHISVLNLRSHSISTFNRYDRRIHESQFSTNRARAPLPGLPPLLFSTPRPRPATSGACGGNDTTAAHQA